MKRNRTLTHTLALAVMMASNAWAALPAPMPKFMDANELADWRAEMAEQVAEKDAAQAKADALAAEQSFFTGKPYLPATGSYAFKYRSYQPELARWTSEDPSGFPDGANANIYAPTPTSEFDWMGLARITVSGKYTMTATWTEQSGFSLNPSFSIGFPDGISLSVSPGIGWSKINTELLKKTAGDYAENAVAPDGYSWVPESITTPTTVKDTSPSYGSEYQHQTGTETAVDFWGNHYQRPVYATRRDASMNVIYTWERIAEEVE